MPEPKKNGAKKAKSTVDTLAKNWLALAVAVAAIVGYVVMTTSMSGKIGIADPDWTRLVFLYNGIQAIAFGAVGYLFGEKVNRERADEAEVRAEGAESSALDEHGKAAAAKSEVASLASSIRAKRNTHRSTGVQRMVEGLGRFLGNDPQATAPLTELRTKAASLQQGAQQVDTSEWDELLSVAEDAVNRLN